jgi:hypothetical protein
MYSQSFGQFGPGKWVFSDHCGKCGVGLHGFAKGIFASGGFLGVGIGQLERAGLGCQAKKINCASAQFAGTLVLVVFPVAVSSSLAFSATAPTWGSTICCGLN